MSDPNDQPRDFIKGATAADRGCHRRWPWGYPHRLFDRPGLRTSAKEGWMPVGKLEDIPVGTPYPFSFTSTQVNGWERTSTSYGGYILRRSEDPDDMLILSIAAAPTWAARQLEEETQAYLCPCHDAKFGRMAKCSTARRRVRWTATPSSASTEDGILEHRSSRKADHVEKTLCLAG